MPSRRTVLLLSPALLWIALHSAAAQTPPAGDQPAPATQAVPTTVPAKPGAPGATSAATKHDKPPKAASTLAKPARVPATVATPAKQPAQEEVPGGVKHAVPALDYVSMLFVFMLATFIGIGVIRRVSRLLHTPLMSLTNAISAIAVVGSIILAGGAHYPLYVRVMGAVALFASMTNIVSGFLITDRMLRLFKTRDGGK